MTNNQISENSISIAKIQDDNRNNKNMFLACLAFLSVMVIVMNENFMQYVTDRLNMLVKYPAFYVMGIFMWFLLNNITINNKFFKCNYPIIAPIVAPIIAPIVQLQPIVSPINRQFEEILAAIANLNNRYYNDNQIAVAVLNPST